MSQINKDYFINDISIPSTRPTGETSIDASIAKYEKEVLQMVLGYELYDLFIANPTDQRFVDISIGKEFEFDFCGKTVKRKWNGLKNADKESLIAYYVYFKHKSNLNTITASISEVKPKLENSNPASANMKLIRAWNNFVELSGDLNDVDRYYCGCRYFDYFDKYNISSYHHVNSAPSLYNFLLANKDTYPEWEFEPSEKINIFGI